MSFLRVVGKDGAAPNDTRCVDAAKELLARCESGEVTAFVTLEDGPRNRDFTFAGDVDLDTFWGLSQRVFTAVAASLEE